MISFVLQKAYSIKCIRDNFGVERKLRPQSQRDCCMNPNKGSGDPELSNLTRTVGIRREELGRKARTFDEKRQYNEVIDNGQ